MKIVGVTISHKPEAWDVPEIPLYCKTGPYMGFKSNTWEKVEFLAALRNKALLRGLERYPDATHILNVESYYLHNTGSLKQLIAAYQLLDCELILASPTFGRFETTITPSERFYDYWAFPGTKGLTPETFPFQMDPRFLQFESVGSCFIAPVKAMLDHPFHNDPDKFPEKFYYNLFCEESGLPVLMDSFSGVWRTVSYPWLKRIRCSLALRTRLNEQPPKDDNMEAIDFISAQ